MPLILLRKNVRLKKVRSILEMCLPVPVGQSRNHCTRTKNNVYLLNIITLLRRYSMRITLITFTLFCYTLCTSAQQQPPRYHSVAGDWAHSTLASLTLRERIGQLFVVATTSCFEQQEEALAASLFKCPYKMDPAHIRYLINEYKIGGLIFLYKSTPELQIAATNEYQALSTIPLLIAQDCEWGLSMRLYNTLEFPKNNLLGKISDKALIYKMGKEVARECKALGVHLNCAPVVDVWNNPDNKLLRYRSFGADPELVAHAGCLMMQGLQDEGILACAKHFPGHGDTSIDSHTDIPCIAHTREHLEQIELVPFKQLIDHGVCAVMPAHLAVPALEPEAQRPSSLSYAITTQLLEHELGFTGLKITDGLGMGALTRHYAPGTIEFEAFLAGNDILLCPLDVPRAVELIEEAILTNRISMEELDRRVLKILKAKEWAGCHKFTPIDTEYALAQLATPQGIALKELLDAEVAISP
jgi:beta-glucosidase-like glycosyl hydrolase